MNFKDFLNESKEEYVIALDDKTYMGREYKFTHDFNKAYVFTSFEDAIDYEEKHGNDIDGLTDIFKVQGKKFTLMT